MEIYVEKFGGASVNSSKAVKNVVNILNSEKKKRVVVISAMGKTTNALESIVELWHREKKIDTTLLENLKSYHQDIAIELFEKESESLIKVIDNIFAELETRLQSIHEGYDFLYDSIVSYGEILSTTIVSHYMNSQNVSHRLINAKDIIRTDNAFRAAEVDWILTAKMIKENITPALEQSDMVLTQGFLGATKEGCITTLGREGSDYSAAIISHCLNAVSTIIWKDVAGLLNADPKRLNDTVKINTVPYSEAIELAYYGATIIHPKTIKPLENLSIPLYIKSFLNPQQEGSVICRSEQMMPLVPSYIFKDNQTLLSIFPKDFSLIAEENISSIFAILAQHKVKVNLMQNSAISFSVCFDDSPRLLPLLLEDLRSHYRVRYNKSLQLITIRHYTQQAIDKVISEPLKIIEQRSRITAQFLVAK
jgi:aspartate kinase